MPRYFDKPEDVIFNPDIEIVPRYDHILYDSIADGRYPVNFLKNHVPKGIDWIDPTTLEKEERTEYLGRFRDALMEDAATERKLRNRIDDAIGLAVKRARWNFTTAIPIYYLNQETICLLLPLALFDDSTVDLALVVTRTPAGGYSGETLYKLRWAYEHARLICRPDNNWLQNIHPDTETGDDVDF